MLNVLSKQELIAKITWEEPQTGTEYDLLLAEGATATIGRAEGNDICIREQHVSRQHAVISFRDGVFIMTDLGSANGVYINDQRMTTPYPLIAGDIIRLHVPILRFEALTTFEMPDVSSEHSRLITAVIGNGIGKLIVTNGPQEGNDIPLMLDTVTVGRATTKADWEVCLQDPSVSRPHARLEYRENAWILYDLGSSNGTLVNGNPVNEKGRMVKDGDVLTFGGTVSIFREN